MGSKHVKEIKEELSKVRAGKLLIENEYSREKELFNEKFENLLIEKQQLIASHELIKKDAERLVMDKKEELENNETILENNRKLIEALEIERAKYKQVRSKLNSAQQELQTKLNSAQQELQTAEITVKESAGIECQLRESLRDLEEE